MLHGLSSTAFLCCLLNFVSKVLQRQWDDHLHWGWNSFLEWSKWFLVTNDQVSKFSNSAMAVSFSSGSRSGVVTSYVELYYLLSVVLWSSIWYHNVTVFIFSVITRLAIQWPEFPDCHLVWSVILGFAMFNSWASYNGIIILLNGFVFLDL